MQIEAGKFYRTRNGIKAGPMAIMRDSWATVEDHDRPLYGRAWRLDGIHDFNDPLLDLVEEWTDSPVREVTRKVIEPGVYGRVKVISGPDSRTPNAVQVMFDGGNPCAPHFWLNAEELRAAAATLIELAAALPLNAEGGDK